MQNSKGEMSALAKIIEMMPPPANPVHKADPSRWGEFEQVLGTKLPADYKEYINLYGSGYIGEEIYILNPMCTYIPSNLVTYNTKWLTAYRKIRAELPAFFPCLIYPETGGILMCGHDRSGGDLCWITTGKPDNWAIAVIYIRDDKIIESDDNLTGFLLRYLLEHNEDRFFRPWWWNDDGTSIKTG